MTAPMLEQAADNLRKKTSRSAVYAAMLRAVHQGSIALEVRPTGPGGAKITLQDWTRKHLQWAEHAGWRTKQESRAMATSLAMNTHLTEVNDDQPTILELGTGWEGAYEGMILTGVRVIACDIMQQRIGPDRMSYPDLLIDFASAQGNLVRHIASIAKVKKSAIIGVFASPSCKEHSVANALGMGTGAGLGLYGGRGNLTSPALMQIILGIQDYVANWGGFYAIENPGYGALRHNPDMIAAFGTATVTTTGCAFGLAHNKPYRFWTNMNRDHPAWRTNAKQWCEACRENKGHNAKMCPPKGDTTPRPKEDGKTNAAARSRMPPELGRSLADMFLMHNGYTVVLE